MVYDYFSLLDVVKLCFFIIKNVLLLKKFLISSLVILGLTL